MRAVISSRGVRTLWFTVRTPPPKVLKEALGGGATLVASLVRVEGDAIYDLTGIQKTTSSTANSTLQ
jgi:hypothetical protein